MCLPRHTRGRWNYGEVGPSPTSWPRRELLPLVVPYCLRVSCCQVYTHARLTIDSTLSDMGDDLFTESKCSNSSFIMLYLVHKMDINYLIVDEMINIKIV
jgi:hypothetical protein